ncbi:MAG: glucosidase, partial [Verrucomicrobiales bacterium]
MQENGRRARFSPEYELADTGVFAEERYFDVFIEYAKAGPDDLLIRVRALNRGPEAAPLDFLPSLWFRNTWIWGCRHEGCTLKPVISLAEPGGVITQHDTLPPFRFEAEGAIESDWLFTENETDLKDGLNRLLINGEKTAVNSHPIGTKAAVHYEIELKPGESRRIVLQLTGSKEANLTQAESLFSERKKEADEFYDSIADKGLSDDQKLIQRQALSGMLWNKQYYYYVVADWLKAPRKNPRNKEWLHLYNEDILSVPDKWEYPCFFSWDTAFHAIPLAMVDPEFAKRQLTLLTREWYMHPSGQIPAYEWSFSDVNPPVHAWASWRVFK